MVNVEADHRLRVMVEGDFDAQIFQRRHMVETFKQSQNHAAYPRAVMLRRTVCIRENPHQTHGMHANESRHFEGRMPIADAAQDVLRTPEVGAIPAHRA